MIGIIDLFLLQLLIQLSLFAAPCMALCANDKCLPGGFFFAVGRDMIEDHALLGHVFRNVTVTEPIRCFEECRCDCRCISFNYLATVSQNNCQLNDDNMNMSPSDLKPSEGSHHYGLAVNYNIKVSTCDSHGGAVDYISWEDGRWFYCKYRFMQRFLTCGLRACYKVSKIVYHCYLS